MKKPRKDRGIETMHAAPLAAVVLLLLANGPALVVTVQPACGASALIAAITGPSYSVVTRTLVSTRKGCTHVWAGKRSSRPTGLRRL